MQRSMQSMIGAAVLAIGTLGAAAAANAANLYVTVGVPAAPAPVYGQSGPGYEPPARMVPVVPRAVYVARHGHWRYDHERRWAGACRASGWDPLTRYLPGDPVWRSGRLYVATALSASVWNVNSPPEWTPNYWMPASCM